MDEPAIKEAIIQSLGEDFILKPEQRGTHPLLQDRVRIDFLAYPLPHLISGGFDEGWFGIEAKDIGDDAKKLNKVVWQSITYAQSTFRVEDKAIRPMFVVVCVGQAPEHLQGRLPIVWPILFSFAQYARVGHLDLHPHRGWGLKFGAGRYYSQEWGKSQVANIGMIDYVGSIS